MFQPYVPAVDMERRSSELEDTFEARGGLDSRWEFEGLR